MVLIKNLGPVSKKIVRLSGASFCQVTKTKDELHERDVITEGNQKWHGAAPNLISSAKRRNKEDIFLLILDHRDRLVKSMTADPRA